MHFSSKSVQFGSVNLRETQRVKVNNTKFSEYEEIDYNVIKETWDDIHQKVKLNKVIC